MDKIMEKVKEIWNRIVEWVKKFTIKQRILIGGLAATVIISLIILGVVLSRPSMEILVVAETTKEAVSIKELLDNDGNIRYEIMDDDLTFKVNSKDKTAAKYLLGTNKIVTEDYTIDDVLNGSFSTTESDKTKKYQLFLEQQLSKDLSQLDNIEWAKVNLSIPVDDGTILAREELTYAAVTLKLEKDLEEGQAEGIAKYIATAVGDETTDAITILDSKSNPLFSGGDDSTTAGTLNKQLNQKNSETLRVKNEIRNVMLGTNLYDNVEVGLNLDMDFTSKTTHDIKYDVKEGREEGFLTEKKHYNSEATGGVAGTPGTDSNDSDTGYVIEDSGVTSSTVSDIDEKYALDSTTTDTVDMGGTIKYEDSSVTVVGIAYKYYNEEEMKESGELGDKTFSEFVAENSGKIEVQVPEQQIEMIAKATGFPVQNIKVSAYEVPYFEYAVDDGRSITDYLEIALAVLIFALLGYVVFRSTRPDKAEELEPELSVESLLESTKMNEEPLEDIGYTEKSDTRILIEKFVEEKPEAAAALLRNWLEEEWE